MDDELAEAQHQAISDPAGAVRDWLRCATQWVVALSEIPKPSKSTKMLQAKEMRILSLKIPQVMDPHKQAPLRDLLESVSEGSLFDWTTAKEVIHLAAKKAIRLAAKENAAEETAKTQTGWNLLTDDNWSDWESCFTGKCHVKVFSHHYLNGTGKPPYARQARKGIQ